MTHAGSVFPLLVSLCLCTYSSPLFAEPPDPAPPENEAPSPKRPVPDYDGRPDEAGDGILWVPRVLAFPFYLVAEYLLRRPMGWLVVTAEREDWPTAVLDFFTFDKEHEVGLIPTAFFDFGFKPSVGLYFFADDVLATGNDVRANVGFWGTDWLSFSLRDRVSLGDDDSVQLGGSWLRRPDYLFHGIGPRSSASHASRFRSDEGHAFLSYDLRLWRLSSLQADAGIRDVRFEDASCCDDPSLLDRVLSGNFVEPPGFSQGYTAAYARLNASLDTRRPAPHPGHGVRIQGFAEQNVELDPDRPPNRWVKYGGKAGGFVDLTGHRRVLGLWLAGAFTEPLGGEELVPFTELASLGGDDEMRGFRPGRLFGHSAISATLQYEWPVWVWLRGTLHLSAGNVFDRHLEDFDPKLLRLSSAIGLRSIGSTDHFLEILTGVGTETYEEGWDVTSFRLLLGGNSGF